jgi:hypothetical protein
MNKLFILGLIGCFIIFLIVIIGCTNYGSSYGVHVCCAPFSNNISLQDAMACKLNNVCTGIINEYIPYKLEQINTTKV